MTETASDLAEFLRARLKEDEQAALAAAGGEANLANWTYDPQTFTVSSGEQLIASHRNGSPLTDVDGAHIALHDPERVLQEVATKRRIAYLAVQLPKLTASVNPFDNDKDAWAETLKQLALPYAKHPAYRQEWMP